MSNFSHNYKYIDLTSSYDITPLDPYYLYINPKDIALNINLTTPKWEGISHKIYNLSDKYAISIITPDKNYTLKPKESLEITYKDLSYIFNSELNLMSEDPVVGVCLTKTNIYGGKWCHVDRNGVPIVLPTLYFTNHPIYSNISSVIIDGQYMVRIPKFYVKYEKIISDNDPRGLPNDSIIRYISPELLPGFHIHPAFIYNNQEIDCFYIGCYNGYIANSKLNSIPDVVPTGGKYSIFDTAITKNNTSPSSGWKRMSIYHGSIISLLTLIEFLTSNIRNVNILGGIVDGSYTPKKVNDSSLHKPWRGLYGLYANIYQILAGVKLVNNILYIFSNDGTDTFINTGLTYSPTTSVTFAQKMSEKKSIDYDLNDVFISDNNSRYQGTNTSPYTCISNNWYKDATTIHYMGQFCIDCYNLFNMIISYRFGTESHAYVGARLVKI